MYKRISSHGLSVEYQMELFTFKQVLFTFKQVLTITLWLLQIYKISWFIGLHLILVDSMIWEEGCHLVLKWMFFVQ